MTRDFARDADNDHRRHYQFPVNHQILLFCNVKTQEGRRKKEEVKFWTIGHCIACMLFHGIVQGGWSNWALLRKKKKEVLYMLLDRSLSYL